MTPTVALVCPRRPDGGHRDQLWEFCRRWWAERFKWPIVEGHHEAGPFNRGAAINAGVRDAGDVDVIVIVDGDVVANTDQVEAAVDTAHRTGRMTLAYTGYNALDQSMTSRALAGFDGSWERGVRLRMASHVSSIVAVPAGLWAATGGFDERCAGWGHDDVIFAHVARVLGGGIERVPGAVWHLWHPTSPERNPHLPELKASKALAHRYYAEHTVDGVQRILAERAEPDGVLLAVLTNGRRECIDLSIDAALENLKGLPITRVLVVDDSGDVDYQAWLRWRFPDVEFQMHHKPTNFADATRRMWSAALASGQRWIFWLEDDFVIERPVDLQAIAGVLEHDPALTQMVLRRQAWFPGEVAAGGLIEEHPELHHDRRHGEHEWVEHARGHWTNPHLVARSFLAAHEWPRGVGSEARFARSLVDRRSAYWGPRSDPPTVTHMGERRGTGY